MTRRTPSGPAGAGGDSGSAQAGAGGIPALRLGRTRFLYDDPIVGPVLPSVVVDLPEDGTPQARPYRAPRNCPRVMRRYIPTVTIGHAHEAPEGVPYYVEGLDEGPECIKADLNDPWGDEAFRVGGRYYGEAMGYNDPQDHARRIACFQTAEILYRHAAGRGNPYGWLGLGYVYSYDRCEGQYFRSRFERWPLDDGTRFPAKPDVGTCAYICYRHAADAGIAEACYKLGDMTAEGRGCEADQAAALVLFRKAYRLGMHHNPCIWGSAALRLGTAHAEGLGCRRDPAMALHWYEIARTGLDQAVREGAGTYDGKLWLAEAGAMDMRQELWLAKGEG